MAGSGSVWPMATGAALVAIAGGTWSAASFAYGDPIEGLWCGTLGLGFAGLAIGILLARPRWSVAASLLAAVPSARWMLDALAHGHSASPWVWFGVGTCGLAVVALLITWRSAAGIWPVAAVAACAGITLLACAQMLLTALGNPTGWIVAETSATLGFLALVAWSARLRNVWSTPG